MKRPGVILRIVGGVLAVVVLVIAFFHWKAYLPWNFPAQMETHFLSEAKWTEIPNVKCNSPAVEDVAGQFDHTSSARFYMAPPDNVEEIVKSLRESSKAEDISRLEELEREMEFGKTIIMGNKSEELLRLSAPTIVGTQVTISVSACRDCYWRVRCLVDGELIGWSETIDPQFPHYLSAKFTWDTSGYETGIHWITFEYIPRWYYFPLIKWSSFDRIYRSESKFTLYPIGTRRGEYGELVIPHD